MNQTSVAADVAAALLRNLDLLGLGALTAALCLAPL